MLGVDFGSDARRTMQALNRSLVIIEYSPDGTVLAANEKFSEMAGYGAAEIVGKRHRMFVDRGYAESAEHREFWAKLKSGKFVAAEFKRVGKGGREIWIQASYNPIFDLNNQVTKVVKFATDVTGRVAAVNQIATGLSRLAEGDLEQRMPTPLIPALEPLRVDFNASMEALEKSMAAVGAATRAITAGAGDEGGGQRAASGGGGQQRRKRLAGILNKRTGRAGRATTACKREEAPT
jgi:methyl-accepting chemotaxis protein